MKKKAEKRKSAGMIDLPGSGLVRINEHGAVESVGDMTMSSPAPPPTSASGPSTSAPPSASAPHSAAVAGPSSSWRIPGASKQQGDNRDDMESESELSELSEVASSQRSGAMPEEQKPPPKKTP